MEKSKLIGQVLLKLTGGVLTSDSAVRYAEAESYLSMAVNYVQTGNYWLEGKAEGERTINPMMLQAFENIPIQNSTDRNQLYADLPKKALALPKGRALELNTKCGKRCIPLGQGDDAMEEYYGCFKGNLISYQVEGQRVWFYTYNPLLESVRGKYIVSVDEIADDEDVLLPSDGEAKVVDLMYGWLSGEKQSPKDYKVDSKDNV